MTAFWWVFRSRETGRLSIVQWPNLPLWVWIVTSITRRLPSVQGRADTVLGQVGTGALVVWAAWELWRGVNPFRRLVGLGVLLGITRSAVFG